MFIGNRNGVSCLSLTGYPYWKEICITQKVSEAPCVVVMPSRYVVTFSPLMDTKEDPQAIIIWDILTGQKKRGFHCESSAHWPIFKSVLCVCLSLYLIVKYPSSRIAHAVMWNKFWRVICLLRWSHDGKFFARMTTDTLSIYETPVSRHTRYTGFG